MFIVILDIGDGRVLQILLCTQYGLCSIRMLGEERGEDRLLHFAVVPGQRHIFFFVYSFQFRMETADDIILEAVCLNLCPVLYLIGGDIFLIDSLVIPCVGVAAGRTDSSHQLVIFVGNGVFGCFVREAVDGVVDRFALCFVRRLAVYLKLLFNLVQ